LLVRLTVILLAAALLAIQVVRNALAVGLASERPADAARVWSGHPAAELSLAMTEIGQASRARRPIPPSAFAIMADAAVKEPLAPEPFLVRGVQAQLAGDAAEAQRAFEEAQWRDPFSRPAAYFLAERYFRTGNSTGALREMAALARLSPGGTGVVAPYLAAYARNPANWPSLRKLFSANSAIAETTLTVLARDAATAPAVLALADPRQTARNAPWLQPLLTTLTTAGKYGEASAVWQRMTGARLTGSIYDAAFRDNVSPPPFNWALTASTVGLAERQPGGRLHVLFYGQEDGFLASEMLLLQPGQYHLTLQIQGDASRARALNWSVWCDKAEAPIASAQLDVVAAHGLTFMVSADCRAEWLKLAGSSSDVPQQADLAIAELKLERSSGG
jgi:hypothetical protein